MLSLLNLVVKVQQYLVTSSCIFLDEKIVHENSLNPGLNLTKEPGPEFLFECVSSFMKPNVC